MDYWADIPSVILLEMMQYLSRRDRLTCGMVCKSWYATMCNPLLWKNMMISLDSDMTDPLTAVAVKRYKTHISSLDLAWSKPYLPRRWLRNRMTTVAQDTCHFLMLLKECNIELLSFKLTDWYFTWKFKKVVYHLTLFLKQQRLLKRLSLTNAYLNKSEILKILFACRNSSTTINHLDLLGSFHECHNVFMNSNFISALQLFNNLEVLKLDYSSLADKVLMAFIENGNTTLKFIEINVKDVDSRSHVINSDTWTKITDRCKKLKIALHIHNICHYEDIYYILVDTMPLQSFILSCGHVWDQSRSRNYCGTLNLLINNFENTLTHVTLQLRNNRELVDRYLFDIVKRCKNLQYLEFDGVLRTMDFVRDVCTLQCNENEYDFNYFHVRPRNATMFSNLLLSDIWRSYAKPLEDIGVNFEVETFSNPAVRIFC